MQSTRTPSTQTWLLQKLRDMGYNPDPEGVCFGVAYTAMSSFLLGGMQDYTQRLHNIKNSNLKKPMLPQQDITDIRAYFDAIEMFHHTGLHRNLYESRKSPRFQDPEKAMEIVMPAQLREEGGVNKAGTLADVYDEDNLSAYLTALKNRMKQNECSFPVSLVFESINHAICVGYDPKADTWTLIDANNLPPKVIPDDKAAEHIISSFLCGNKAILSCDVFVHNRNAEAMSACLQDIRHDIRETSAIDQKKVKTRDKFQSSLIAVAARKGMVDLLEDAIRAEPGCVNYQDDMGSTPLYKATQDRYYDVAETLLKNNADPNLPNRLGGVPLFMAVMEGDLKMVELLLQYEAKPHLANIDNESPIYLAADTRQWRILITMLLNMKNASQISSKDMNIINQNRHLLAEEFCRIMERVPDQGNRNKMVESVLASENAFGAIMNKGQSIFNTFFSKNRYHDKKVTESIKS